MTELRAIVVKTLIDDHPPLDHLGEYRDRPGPTDRTIDRTRSGHFKTGQYRYFVSTDPERAEENFERMEEYSRGDVVSYGIVAHARISVGGTVQTIKSGGIWGIPSDADPEYAADLAAEEVADLRDILEGLGVYVSEPVEAEWTQDSGFSGTVTA